jgi:hypothetical protein
MVNKTTRSMWVIMEKKRNAHRIFVGNLKKRDHLEDLRVDGMTSKCILTKEDWMGRTASVCVRKRTRGGVLKTR